MFGSLKIYANACICIYFNETFHCKAINCNARRNEKFLDLIEKTYPYKGYCIPFLMEKVVKTFFITDKI